MKILHTILLFLSSYSLVLAVDTPAKTDLKQYDVEIIIFEDAHARYINSQSWAHDATDSEMPVITKDVIENLDAMSLDDIIATDFKTNKPSILEENYKRLKSSADYEVLFYGAWRQSGLDKSKAFEINLNELDNVHNTRSTNTITGSIKLILARYLHLYNKLSYQRITSVNKTIENSNESSIPEMVEKTALFEINSHRRMRSKELHYIDHPLIGVLVQINPVKKIKESEQVLKK